MRRGSSPGPGRSLVSLGDPAVIEIDALPGVVFESTGRKRSRSPDGRMPRTEHSDDANGSGCEEPGQPPAARDVRPRDLTLNPGALRRCEYLLVSWRNVVWPGRVRRVVRDGKIQTIPVVLAPITASKSRSFLVWRRANRWSFDEQSVDDGSISIAGEIAVSNGH